MATLGEQRIRVDFNPSQEGVVYDFKRHTAALIDLLHKMADKTDDPEKGRLISIAMTYYETAGMYAVKAATAK